MIRKIIQDRKKANSFFLQKSGPFRAFSNLEQVAFSAGKLSKKEKELIAIGISIVKNCESCMEWHIHEAMKDGASESEILEAIGVGIEMGGDPATVSARFAMKVIGYYKAMNNVEIREVEAENDLQQCVDVIQKAFKTVARDFDLTEENCPTHPSFITLEHLTEMINKGLRLCCLFENQVPVGFIAVENKDDTLFYIEKLAVLPACRHKGFGGMLLEFALDFIKYQGGQRVSISLIDANLVLKDWYQTHGFVVTGTQDFSHLPFTVCFMEQPLNESYPEKAE